MGLRAIFVGALSLASSIHASLIVKTRTGIFTGKLNDTYPDVAQWKWIPFAKPPVGERRWKAPQRLSNSSMSYDSTTYGPACSQYVSAIPTVWGLNITGNLVVNYGESLFAGRIADNSAEDCLSLAVWAPANVTADAGLPVIIFTTGGGWSTGGINIPTQLPSQWVHRSQKHIVVTINYRVNIFAQPNARATKGAGNFGNLDQRMAVEWVQENIAAFGGDPKRMTLWGQSAGASLTSWYGFTYWKDPIVQATIASSGSVYLGVGAGDPSGSNFTFVAKSMGCDFQDADLELECMRRVPVTRIENFIGGYADNSTLVNPTQPALSFGPEVDEKIIFSNYTQRTLRAKLAKIPQMIGTTAREGAPFAPYPFNNITGGPPLATINAITTELFVCDAWRSSVERAEAGFTTYRYEWAGNFTNLGGGVPWLGAYHYSDLYMLFGSYGINPGPIPELEIMTSAKMQDLFYDFITDPNSLPAHGWPEYDATAKNGGRLAQFGADGKVLQLVTGNSVEGACHIPGQVYNSTP